MERADRLARRRRAAGAAWWPSTQVADPADAVRRERDAIRRALPRARGWSSSIRPAICRGNPRTEPNAAFLTRVFAAHDAALVLVTEDLGVLRQTCDTVQVLLAGRIVERGPAQGNTVVPTSPVCRDAGYRGCAT